MTTAAPTVRPASKGAPDEPNHAQIREAIDELTRTTGMRRKEARHILREIAAGNADLIVSLLSYDDPTGEQAVRRAVANTP